MREKYLPLILMSLLTLYACEEHERTQEPAEIPEGEGAKIFKRANDSEKTDLNSAIQLYLSITTDYPTSSRTAEASGRVAQICFMSGLKKHLDGDSAGALLMYRLLARSTPEWERIGDVEFLILTIEMPREMSPLIEEARLHFRALVPLSKSSDSETSDFDSEDSADPDHGYIERIQVFKERVKMMQRGLLSTREAMSRSSPRDLGLMIEKMEMRSDINYIDEKLSEIIKELEMILIPLRRFTDEDRSFVGSLFDIKLLSEVVVPVRVNVPVALEGLASRMKWIAERPIADGYVARNRETLHGWGYKNLSLLNLDLPGPEEGPTIEDKAQNQAVSTDASRR